MDLRVLKGSQGMGEQRMVESQPFGLNDAAKEVDVLPDLFYEDVEFNVDAIDPNVFIILGRRGAGKTALAHYFSFQKRCSYDIYVDIDEPQEFTNVLERIYDSVSDSDETVLVDELAKVWLLSFWTALLAEAVESPTISAARRQDIEKYLKRVGLMQLSRAERSLRVVASVLQKLLSVISKKAGEVAVLTREVLENLSSPDFVAAKEAVLGHLDEGNRAVIVLDTLEQYAVRNPSMQHAVGALIHAVTQLAHGGAHRNLHVKCFLPAEIVYYLQNVIPNIGKTYDQPVILHWRPKVLMRMLCWRYVHYLRACGQFVPPHLKSVKWNSHQEVREKVWYHFFPRTVVSSSGVREESFPFVIRHSQQRPRQVIGICNAIAKHSRKGGRFPTFAAEDVVDGVASTGGFLAREIINAFKEVYPNALEILRCFRAQPDWYNRAADLYKISRQTKNEWPAENPYSQHEFMQMVCEMGIIGAVRKTTDRFYEAEFEYTLNDRLIVSDKESVCVHPMFRTILGIRPIDQRHVYPVGPE